MFGENEFKVLKVLKSTDLGKNSKKLNIFTLNLQFILSLSKTWKDNGKFQFKNYCFRSNDCLQLQNILQCNF